MHECQGVWGWLFGHKFKDGHFEPYAYKSDHCMRCGMPKGGWPRVRIGGSGAVT